MAASLTTYHCKWRSTLAWSRAAGVNRLGQSLRYAGMVGLALIATLSCVTRFAYAQTAVSTTPPLALTRFGEARPAGWMLDQMRADLNYGLAGHYPDISDTVNMGVFETHAGDVTDASGDPGWWYGEHEGYYADGLFRQAWLSGLQSFVQAAEARLQDVLASQDSSGYIGIYPPDQRFGDQDQNDGELWTQSRMFQALLAWYEATGDQQILDDVEKAAKLTLAEYEYRSYFERLDYVTDGGGVSHGVGFSDTLEWLYRLTGDDTYRLGYLWLYADYANSNVRDDDLTPTHLSDPARPWYSHTPHTAEALAMPAIAYAYGGPAQDEQAADQLLGKLRRYSNPGGGPVGDEWANGHIGSFEMESEYCSMTETIASLNRLAQFRDPMATGDIAERIALNAAQGARLHPADTGVSYLTSDNRLSATLTAKYGDRTLYSASHQTAACCSLNSTRLLPYYVEGMWLRDTGHAGLVARLYGPSLLDTTIDGTSVDVYETTDFPFSDHVAFTLSPAKPMSFTLTLRIPAYAPDASVTVPADMQVVRETDRFEITGTWKPDDNVSLDLAFSVRTVHDADGEVAMAYGPLLFALPIDAVATEGRLTQSSDPSSTLEFHDTEFTPASATPSYLLPRDLDFVPVQLPDGDTSTPWSNPPVGLDGSLLAADGSRVNVTLLPLGSTVLRIAGFRTDELFGDGFGP